MEQIEAVETKSIDQCYCDCQATLIFASRLLLKLYVKLYKPVKTL